MSTHFIRVIELQRTPKGHNDNYFKSIMYINIEQISHFSVDIENNKSAVWLKTNNFFLVEGCLDMIIAAASKSR